MGLFINSDKHPDVYKNQGQIQEPNQSFFKQNHLTDLLEEQQKTSEKLHQSFSELKDLLENQATKQTIQWKFFQHGFNEQKKVNYHHEKVENQVLDWLKKLDGKSEALQTTLENETLGNKDLMNYMNQLSLSNQEVANRLDKVGLRNEKLEQKVDEQLILQKQMAHQMNVQENTHTEVMSRLDNQEALAEKILRQVDHFRSILFERTNYLAEKIDTGYNYTTSYITKLFTGSDHPLTHFVINQKSKDNEKKKP